MNELKKICIACKKEKDISNFYFRKDTNKYKNTCLECEKIRKNQYYLDNKVHLVEKQKRI